MKEQVPEELLAILSDQELFANPAELSSKDILKKAELYMRERQRFRGRAPAAAGRPPQRGEIRPVSVLRDREQAPQAESQ